MANKTNMLFVVALLLTFSTAIPLASALTPISTTISCFPKYISPTGFGTGCNVQVTGGGGIPNGANITLTSDPASIFTSTGTDAAICTIVFDGYCFFTYNAFGAGTIHTINAIYAGSSNSFIITVVNPKISVNPSNGPIDSAYIVTASGFSAEGFATISFNSVTQVPIGGSDCIYDGYGNIEIDSNGNFTCTFIAPSQTEGIYGILGTDTTGVTASNTFTVIVPGGKAFPIVTTKFSANPTLVDQTVFDTANISGGNDPTGNITWSIFNTPMCTGSAATSLQSVSGDGTYVADADAEYYTPGNYSWNVAYSGDENNNNYTSACEVLVVNLPPLIVKVHPSVPKTLDVGQSVPVNALATGGTGSYSYSWASSGCIDASSGSGDALELTPTRAETCMFTFTANDIYTSNTASVDITVNPALQVLGPFPSLTVLNQGQNISLQSTTKGGTSPYTYQWLAAFGSNTLTTGSANTLCSPNANAQTCLFETTNLTQTGTYKFRLMGTDSASTHHTITTQDAYVVVTNQTNTNSVMFGNVTIGPGTSPTISDPAIGFTFVLSANGLGGSTNVIIGNVIGSPPFPPANYISLSVVNISVNPLVVGNIIVTASYPCGLSPGIIQPFVLSTADTWTAISPLTFNIPACTIKFTISTDAVIAITKHMIVVPPLVTKLMANRTYISSGQSALLTSITTGGTGKDVYSYTITATNGTSTGAVKENVNLFKFTSPGHFFITLHVTDRSGEKANSTVLFSVTKPLSVDLTSNKTMVNAGQSVEFAYAFFGGTPGSTHHYDGTLVVNTTSGYTISGHTIKFTKPGKYLVHVKGTDISGEMATSNFITIKVR